jgi:hypothetical protein
LPACLTLTQCPCLHTAALIEYAASQEYTRNNIVKEAENKAKKAEKEARQQVRIGVRRAHSYARSAARARIA